MTAGSGAHGGTAGSGAHGGTAAGTWRHRQWLPLLVSGVIITGAVPLSTWCIGMALGWRAVRGWGGYYALGGFPRPATFPSPGGFFLLNNALYSGTRFYLGWYWAVALTGGTLVAALWYRRAARRLGGHRPGRALPAGAAVATALALALPLLGRAAPALAQQWMRLPWVHGIPALLVIAAALAATAWQERTRGAALVLAGYAVLALLAGWLVTLDVDPALRWLFPAGPGGGWPGALLGNPLTALLLPGLLLVAAGLASFDRRRRVSSADAVISPAA